jgi:hypothetical protein
MRRREVVEPFFERALASLILVDFDFDAHMRERDVTLPLRSRLPIPNKSPSLISPPRRRNFHTVSCDTFPRARQLIL